MSYLHGHVHQKYLESPCEIKLLLHNSFFQNKKTSSILLVCQTIYKVTLKTPILKVKYKLKLRCLLKGYDSNYFILLSFRQLLFPLGSWRILFLKPRPILPLLGPKQGRFEPCYSSRSLGL